MDSEKQGQNLYPPVYEATVPTPMQSVQHQDNNLPYPSSPPQYFQQPPMNAPPIVITQQPTAGTTIIVHNAQVGRHPQAMTCPNCRGLITTTVTSEPVLKTHLVAVGCCLIGCWFGCCLIPYCVDSCQGQRHTCPNCNNHIGMHK